MSFTRMTFLPSFSQLRSGALGKPLFVTRMAGGWEWLRLSSGEGSPSDILACHVRHHYVTGQDRIQRRVTYWMYALIVSGSGSGPLLSRTWRRHWECPHGSRFGLVFILSRSYVRNRSRCGASRTQRGHLKPPRRLYGVEISEFGVPCNLRQSCRILTARMLISSVSY